MVYLKSDDSDSGSALGGGEGKGKEKKKEGRIPSRERQGRGEIESMTLGCRLEGDDAGVTRGWPPSCQPHRGWLSARSTRSLITPGFSTPFFLSFYPFFSLSCSGGFFFKTVPGTVDITIRSSEVYIV